MLYLLIQGIEIIRCLAVTANAICLYLPYGIQIKFYFILSFLRYDRSIEFY